MTTIAELVADLRYQVDRSSEKKVDSNLASLVKRAGQAAVAFGAAFSATKLVGFVNETARAADNIAKTSRQFGISAREFQVFGFAAERTGVEVSKLGPALRAITRRAGEAAKGNKTYAQAFADIGLQVTDAQGKLKGTGVLFREIADGIAGIESQGERLRVLQTLADEMGPGLVNLFEGGSAAIDGFEAELEKLGIVTDRQLKQMEDYQDTLTNLDRSWFSLKVTLVTAITPLLTGISNLFVRLKASMPNESFQALGRILIILTGIAAAFAIALNFNPIVLLIGAALLGLAVILEDLWVMFTGGESVIGDFIDSMFGEGSAAWVVEFLTDAFNVLIMVLKSLWEAVKITLAPFVNILKTGVVFVVDLVKNFVKLYKMISGGGLGKLFDRIADHDFAGTISELKALGQGALAGANFDETGKAVASVASSELRARRDFSAGVGLSSAPQVSVQVNAQTNASPADIARATENGTRQGVGKAMRNARNSRVPATP